MPCSTKPAPHRRIPVNGGSSARCRTGRAGCPARDGTRGVPNPSDRIAIAWCPGSSPRATSHRGAPAESCDRRGTRHRCTWRLRRIRRTRQLRSRVGELDHTLAPGRATREGCGDFPRPRPKQLHPGILMIGRYSSQRGIRDGDGRLRAECARRISDRARNIRHDQSANRRQSDICRPAMSDDSGSRTFAGLGDHGVHTMRTGPEQWQSVQRGGGDVRENPLDAGAHLPGPSYHHHPTFGPQLRPPLPLREDAAPDAHERAVIDEFLHLASCQPGSSQVRGTGEFDIERIDHRPILIAHQHAATQSEPPGEG